MTMKPCPKPSWKGHQLLQHGKCYSVIVHSFIHSFISFISGNLVYKDMERYGKYCSVIVYDMASVVVSLLFMTWQVL
jgi:hypothetical protein